jgi:hypothetical protein
MYQQLWGYKVEEKLYLGVREQKRLNTTVLEGIMKLKIATWNMWGIRHELEGLKKNTKNER